jgi:hypothetical protein
MGAVVKAVSARPPASWDKYKQARRSVHRTSALLAAAAEKSDTSKEAYNLVGVVV